jgi:thiamine biosynthesis protein ThiS
MQAREPEVSDCRRRADLLRTEQMQIVVNGQTQQAPEKQTLAELLDHLGIDAARVAIELNGAIVRRDRWKETPVESGATLEIVQFVGGG